MRGGETGGVEVVGEADELAAVGAQGMGGGSALVFEGGEEAVERVVKLWR